MIFVVFDSPQLTLWINCWVFLFLLVKAAV